MTTGTTKEFANELSSVLAQLADAGPVRQQSEDYLNRLIVQSPAQVFVTLVTLCSDSTDAHIRFTALTLLRTMPFKALPGSTNDLQSKELWDSLNDQAKMQIQEGLVKCLIGCSDKATSERSAVADCVAAIEREGRKRGEHWPSLTSTLSTLFSSSWLTLRETAFRIYADLPSLLESSPSSSVIAGLTQGLKDESHSVQLAALAAATAVICETEEVEKYAGLIAPMLEILPSFATERSEGKLTQALFSFIDIASTPKLPSRIFRQHLSSILTFALSLINPSPYTTSPYYSASPFDETVRAPAMELLISISELAPTMVRSHPTFVNDVVAALLNLMCERDDDPDWVKSEDFDDDDNESLAVTGEGDLDRIARALGSAVFNPTLLYANQHLISSPVWQHRYAALSSIASIAEGCVELISDQLTPIVGLLIQSTSDKHPQVQYAAIYAIGQLCTDLEGGLQELHGREILQALVTTTNSSEPKLQAYAAACFVNFFQNCEAENLLDILPIAFVHLARLLDQGKLFVKEHGAEALTLLAGCMQEYFSPLYSNIMPQILYLLESAGDEELRSLRAKLIDCASTIADAVDPSLFAVDANRLLSAMHQIQSSITEDDDITLRYLLRAYSQLAATVGPETFAPFVQNVLPYLVEGAERKAETLVGDDVDEAEDDWETVEIGGKRIAIRISSLEEKVEAVENLVLLVQALGTSLDVTTLEKMIAVAMPLLTFYFHLGVREAGSTLVAVTLQALSMAAISQDRLKAILNGVSSVFIESIAGDTDAEILAVFLASFTSCIASLPGCLSPLARQNFIKAIESQLKLLQDREHERAQEVEDADDRLEFEDYADVDASVFSALSRSISAMMKDDPTTFPLDSILPFLAIMNDQLSSSDGVTFTLRLMYSIMKFIPNGATFVESYLPRVLSLLLDADADTRGHSAAVVSIAVPTYPVPLADFAIAAIEPLFQSIGPIDMDDNSVLAARDNSLSALCKIIQTHGKDPRIGSSSVISRWVAQLPVLVDGEEFEPVCSLLDQLVAGNHPSVSPATKATSTHVVKVLVSMISSDVAPDHVKKGVVQTLKGYLVMTGDSTVISTMPFDVRRLLSE